ncbi:ATP-dependent rRNA helicase SPB4 [Astathelohania contejeani]|uniref:ATP-dependent RNA helicase n=1 Tax=Astathelohania contejeani TaxID=164912 RepID=A0ABQ7I1S1_9MICR|nr:ATP-dependent rRNA helicase SPB4 [Thelohania contejeani]
MKFPIKLHNKITQELESKDIQEFTEIQKQVIPIFMKCKDVIVQSQTGSGKTFAFLIPIINNIYKSNLSKTKVHSLIIVPTRELALQIQNVAASFQSINCVSFIGGSDIKSDEESLTEGGISIVVSTPGRLNELISRYKTVFSQIKYLVFDEADKLLSFGFRPIIISILQHIPKDRCTGLFSATIDDGITSLAKLSLKNPTMIKISQEQNTPIELTIKYIKTKAFNKLKFLSGLLRKAHCIVFFATCAQVDYFGELFIRIGCQNLYMIHGKMAQSERSIVYEEFSKARGILFCTDVAARGIDFKGVDKVIHWDVPGDAESFIHRSGRTGRNGNTGEAVAFIMENELKYVNYLKIKKINIVEYGKIEGAIDMSYEEIKNKFDEELLNKSVKAFVSYLQYYKKHTLNYILSFSELNFDSLAALHFLDKIPKMKEIGNIEFERFKRLNNDRSNKNKKSKNK